jgi:hypothetical protein
MRAVNTIFVLSLVAMAGCFGNRHQDLYNNDDAESSSAAGTEGKNKSSDAGAKKDASRVQDASADGSTRRIDGGGTCGNARIDGDEICDGVNLGGATCATLSNSQMRGTLACANDCQSYDMSRCYYNSADYSDGGRSDGGTVVRDAGRDSSTTNQNRTLVNGGCARSNGSSCQSDLDCAIGGCGKELCYNPSYGTVTTTCDCVAPTNLSCGCVNSKCGWWQ